MRRLVAETKLSRDDLIAPLFVREGIDDPVPITSLPGVMQHTRQSIRESVATLVEMGVPGVMLFGLPLNKDAVGSEAWNPDGVVQITLRDLRDDFGDLIVLMADLCVDEYTDHGHCGIVGDGGVVDNDATLELYQRVAVAQADAGASVVAPSGMMDGQVGAIRQALDAEGFETVPILAYSAKYASAEYGPFREAVDVTIVGGGDRKSYQQDPANSREAMEEIRLDLDEGADMVMVKPAPYLPRHHRRSPPAVRRTSRGLSRIRGVRDVEGCRRQWMDRWRGHGHRASHCNKASRCRHDPHLPGPPKSHHVSRRLEQAAEPVVAKTNQHRSTCREKYDAEYVCCAGVRLQKQQDLRWDGTAPAREASCERQGRTKFTDGSRPGESGPCDKRRSDHGQSYQPPPIERRGSEGRG